MLNLEEKLHDFWQFCSGALNNRRDSDAILSLLVRQPTRMSCSTARIGAVVRKNCGVEHINKSLRSACYCPVRNIVSKAGLSSVPCICIELSFR